ncbi:MAG: hypothetical protein CL916_14860, partial [Deltaproteobacteria bacterium]|nr:hypothetical protein [Deltaproteobacteria bacterium]
MTSKIPTISVEKLNYHLLRRICSEHLDQDVCTIQEYIALSFGRQNLESVLLFLWYQVKKLQILLHSLDKRYFKKVFSLLHKLHVRASTIDNMVMFDMEKKENLLVDAV